MKKFIVMSLGLAAAVSMSAQVALVKDAEKAFKGADKYADYAKAIELITPAFSNPETKDNAQTYWIPGKQGFKVYDNMYLEKSIGKDVNVEEMGTALLDGYKYGMMALAVDTVVDAKGKVKTKFSKEIASTIGGHLADFANTGSIFWDTQKYPQAYEAFMAYLSIPENPRLGQAAPKALPDSMAAQISYFAGLSAWQANMLPEAAAAFEKMMDLGYNDMAAYDYAYSVAYQMGDDAKKLAYSQRAFDKFGNQKPEFLQRIIQSYITAKNYDTALNYLEDAIKADPNNANYYYLEGVLYDDQDNKEKSMELYKKAVELDPSGALYNFSYGTALLQKFEKMDDAASSMAQGDYNKYRFETLNPIIKDAATYLEKAYKADPENMRNALINLKIIYYNLNDGENLKRVEDLLNS